MPPTHVVGVSPLEYRCYLQCHLLMCMVASNSHGHRPFARVQVLLAFDVEHPIHMVGIHMLQCSTLFTCTYALSICCLTLLKRLNLCWITNIQLLFLQWRAPFTCFSLSLWVLNTGLGLPIDLYWASTLIWIGFWNGLKITLLDCPKAQ